MSLAKGTAAAWDERPGVSALLANLSYHRRAVAWWAAGAAIMFGIGLIAGHGDHPLIDLRVYRVGGLAWLKGFPLYASRFPAPLTGPPLPFTYPPFAAVAFSGLSLIGYFAAAAVMVIAGLAFLTWSLRLMALVSGRALPLKTVVAITLCSLVLEPISSTFLHGQINLILMGLVVSDCLMPRTRLPRGVLAGIAAAMKLTPAVFLMFFVVKRQWRAAATMLTSFALATGFAAVLAPKDSKAYWTSTVYDPSRIGDLAYASNQSLRGAFHRLGLGSGTEVKVWYLASALVIVLAFLGARHFRRTGDDVTALLVVAGCQLLISPVSWSHHWVWVAPALMLPAVRIYRERERVPMILMSALLLVFVIGPHWLLPNNNGHELRWAWWENLVGDTYTIFTFCFVLWAAIVALRARSPRPSSFRFALPAIARRGSGLE